MRLIDTHLHLIDRRVTTHPWTVRAEALAGRDFTLEEAQGLYGGHVMGSIFMEVAAEDWRAEARWIGGLVRAGRLRQPDQVLQIALQRLLAEVERIPPCSRRPRVARQR